jgi:hypothetical protein
MRLCTALPILAAAAAALAFLPRGDRLSFHPAADSEVARDYEIEVDVDQIDISATINGQDMSGMIPGDLSLMFKVAASVADKFVKTVDGKPIDLIRSYEKLSVAMEAPDTSESDTIDELEGKRVRFLWNEETGAYDASFYESEGEERVLAALGADMDLTGVLPAGDVSEGDTWELSPEEQERIVTFGMDPNKLEQEGEDAEIMAMVEELLQPQIDKLSEAFKATCTYKGKRTEGSVEVAVIELALTGAGGLDLVEVIDTVARKQIPPEVEVDMTIREANVNLQMSGRGTLLWNLAAGHLEAFDMTCDLEIKANFDMSASAQGQDQDVNAEVDASGKVTWKVSKP